MLVYIDCGLSLQLQERSASWKAETCGRFELRRDCEDGILDETAKKDLLGPSFNERLRCVSKARYETDFKIIEETNSSKDLRTSCAESENDS